MSAASDRPWHLPGLPGTANSSTTSSAPASAAAWHEGETPAGRRFRTPRLSGEMASAVAEAVREAALRARRERRLDEVVRAVARAAGRLADPGDEVGRGAVAGLCKDLGWSAELAAETLAGMAATWTEASLRGLIDEELGDPAVLGGFAAKARLAAGAGAAAPDGTAAPGSRRRHAVGPPLLLQVLAGNVPGVAVTAALRGLLVRSGVLCKTPRAEPGLLPRFARALAAEDPLLGASLAATWWPAAADVPAWDAWVKRSGKVVVYGGDEAVDGVRRRLPAHVELLVYGPKLGAGVVLADADPGAAAAGAARDICAYDQGGCVSPRLIYVLGDAGAFAERLADALEAESARLPRPAPGPAEALAIRSLHEEAEWGEGRRLLASSGDLAWTILVEPAPSALSEGLTRVLRVCPLDRLEDLGTTLAPLEGRVQAIGYAGREGLEALAGLAAELGVARVAPFGTVAWPPADWRHDGRHQLLPLVGWTDWELPYIPDSDEVNR